MIAITSLIDFTELSIANTQYIERNMHADFSTLALFLELHSIVVKIIR